MAPLDSRHLEGCCPACGMSSLFDCGLHAYLKGLDGPPAAHGRYRVFDEDGRWRFFLIGEGVRSDG